MTTSQNAPVWTEIHTASQLSQKALGYFRARLKNRLYQLLLSEYEKLVTSGYTKARLAKRVDKRPEQITRLLGAPGNWTLDTVSDLLLAMGYELNPQVSGFDENGSQVTTSAPWKIGPAEKQVDIQNGTVATLSMSE